MTRYVNPFTPVAAERHAIWEMLVERDIEAFVRRAWRALEADFIVQGFFGIDAGLRDRPDAWTLAFPHLAAYGDAWLQQAELMATRADEAEIRSGLIRATTLRDIELNGSAALAHKKFDGEIELRDGGREHLRWQTLYHCRKVGSDWKIAGFVGYLPNPMGGGDNSHGERSRTGQMKTARTVKRVPPHAAQHLTAGPYSPVLRVSGHELVVISGQAALATDGSLVGDDIATQAHQTLDNCTVQLATAGCTLADVFKVNVYLTDLNDWQAFNEIYAARMPDPKPVRTAVQSGLLPGLLIEMEMWAAKGR